MTKSTKGYGNLYENTSGAKNKNYNEFAKYNGSIDDFLKDPNIFTKFTHSQIFNWLKEIKMDPKPLSKGKFKDIPYEQGGGYKVNWNGDKLFQYHPPGGHHGGIAYYKISDGKGGISRYTLKGEKLK